MTRRCIALCAVFAVGLTGCATRFSPDRVRDLVREQTGSDPRSAFELNLGHFSTMLIKNTMAVASDDPDAELPFAGVDKLQLAVYEVPPGDAPALDVTRIPIRGWEPVVKFHDERRSGAVLIRTSGETVKDLVVVGAGLRQVVYGRVQGSLSADLPQTLARVLQDGGPDALRDSLNELAGSTDP